jgi:hypothetical protein
MEGFDPKRRITVDRTGLKSVIILGNEIPCSALNYAVNCHQIKPRLFSALPLTVTATSEGLFAPLEGCLCLLDVNIILLYLCMAQYFKPSIVFNFNVTVQIPFCQTEMHRNEENHVFSIP